MYTNRKVPFFSALINISLVLFFLGIFFFIAIAGQVVLNSAMEELEFKIILAHQTEDKTAQKLLELLETQPFTSDVYYVSKQEALKIFRDIGDDFLEAMDGNNPLPPTVNLRLRPEYVSRDSIEVVTRYVTQFAEVTDIYYPVTLIEQLESNLTQLRIAAWVVGIVLIMVALFLIVNTVRMAIYARRLQIRSMELIGATEPFIRWPFIRLGLIQGLLGGLIADVLIYLLLIIVAQNMYLLDLSILLNSSALWLLFFSLIVLGGLLGWISSTIAVNRYLNKQLDQIA